MEPEKLAIILQDAKDLKLIAFSGDAIADGHLTNYFVPVDKVDIFIAFVASHPLVVTSAQKPYVGKVYGLQRHKKMRVHRLHTYAYRQCVDSNVLFPTACLILDETDTHLCVLGNDNCKYWIKRYYFTGPVQEDGTVLPKKRYV